MGLFPVIGMDRLRPGHRVLVDASAGPAPNLFIGRTQIKDLVGCWSHYPKHFTNVFRQLAKHLFAGLHGLLGLLALGDVRTEADVPQELTACRKPRLCRRSEPPPLAIGTSGAR